MKLFVLSEISELLYLEMIRAQQRGPITIVVTRPELKDKIFEETGLRSVVIPLQRRGDQDVLFHDTFMPGVLDRYQWYDFPIWKAVGMDRLKFWFHGDEADGFMEILELVDVSEVTVSFDVNSWLPWETLAWATSIGVPTSLVKTQSIRNKISYWAAKMLQPDKLVVSFDDEAELYKKVLPDTEIVPAGPRPARRSVSESRKAAIRDGLGLPGDRFLTGIVYDRRDEWAFRRLAKLLGGTSKLAETLIFPYDTRSEELFDRSIPHDVVYGMLCDSPRLLEACDELITFRYLEDVMGMIPNIPVAIYDFLGRQLAEEMAYDVIKVFK